jgi:iron(III) transport system substrate-binding protein
MGGFDGVRLVSVLAPKRWRAVAVVGLAGTAAILSVSACGSAGSAKAASSSQAPTSWGSIVKASKTEPGSVVLVGDNFQVQANDAALAAAVSKANGLKINAVGSVDANTDARVAAEHTSGKHLTDIIVSSSLPQMEEFDKAGYFAKPVMPNLKNIKSNLIYGNVVEISTIAYSVLYNTNLVSNAPSTPEDLLSPSLKGKIGLIVPNAPSTVEQYLWLEAMFGKDILQKLASQNPHFYPSATLLVTAATAGEIAAAPVVPLIPTAPGSPVKWAALPKTNVFNTPFYMAILASAPHPAAAQVVANTILSRDGQVAVAKGQSPDLPGIPGAAAPVRSPWTPPASALTSQAITQFQESWSSIFHYQI